MRTARPPSTGLQTPWDTILGTRSHVRVLRALEQSRESMTVRELARRAGEHLRSVQLAVERLVGAGVVERAGTGAMHHVRLNQRHPLTPALEDLFQFERARFARLVRHLTQLGRRYAGEAAALWFRQAPIEGEPGLEVHLLAPSDTVDALTDRLREATGTFMRREDVAIAVHGWTEPDLSVSGGPGPAASDSVVLLGRLPGKRPQTRTRRRPRSHADVDAALRERAARVAAALHRQPELIRKAREEIRARLPSVSGSEAKTLREWQQVLDAMSPPRLRRWLVSRDDQAARLRQSLPLAFLEAADHAPPRRGPTP